MRVGIWLIVVLLGQTAPLLDLSNPSHGLRVGWAGGYTRTIPLELTVEIVDLIDSTYTVGESFVYEVKVTNSTTTAIDVPWSDNPYGSDIPPTAQTFRGSISLWLGSGPDVGQVVTAAGFFGDREIPATVHRLAPGSSIHVRASGEWLIPGVNMRDFLAPTGGRIAARAVLRVQDGGTMATTAPSVPQMLTLAIRQE